MINLNLQSLESNNKYIIRLSQRWEKNRPYHVGILPSGWLLLTSNDGVSDTDERRATKKVKKKGRGWGDRMGQGWLDMKRMS